MRGRRGSFTRRNQPEAWARRRVQLTGSRWPVVGKRRSTVCVTVPPPLPPPQLQGPSRRHWSAVQLPQPPSPSDRTPADPPEHVSGRQVAAPRSRRFARLFGSTQARLPARDAASPDGGSTTAETTGTSLPSSRLPPFSQPYRGHAICRTWTSDTLSMSGDGWSAYPTPLLALRERADLPRNTGQW